MFSRVMTSGLLGLEGYGVMVETDMANGIPAFEIVGLADTAVKEARERVRAAIRNSGLHFPSRRIVVNLSPADTRKEGSGFDLAVAVGILVSMGQLPNTGELRETVLCGELALDGSLRPVTGALSKALACREAGARFLVLPVENASEAAWVEGLEVLPANSLDEVCRHLNGTCRLARQEPSRFGQMAPSGPNRQGEADFVDVKGQAAAKRAIEVAAAGGHHLFLVGGPGAGKTMLASRIAGILPEPCLEESLEMTRIHSVVGFTGAHNGLIDHRPFRAPHHTISTTGLIGGGRVPRPGEISLAHGGVLFLDEFPEFNRYALDALRQPMENGEVVLSRIQATLRYPSRFMLVAASNPCKCGYYGDPARSCTCSPHDAEHYFAKLSGPLLDRFDIRHRVPSLSWKEATGMQGGETSSGIRDRVSRARAMQLRRYQGTAIHHNAQLSGRLLSRWCALDTESLRLLEKAYEAGKLSMRGHDRVLRVARTLADLDDEAHIRLPHLAEALRYRNADA